jgi:hypothetical protein
MFMRRQQQMALIINCKPLSISMRQSLPQTSTAHMRHLVPKNHQLTGKKSRVEVLQWKIPPQKIVLQSIISCKRTAERRA